MNLTALYQAIHGALVKHGAPTGLVADIDAFFHTPGAAEAAAPAAAPPATQQDQGAQAGDPYNRPPWPSYWRYTGPQGVPISSPPFTCPGGMYTAELEVYQGTEVKVDGVKIPLGSSAQFHLDAGQHVATVENDTIPLSGTLQFTLRKPD